MNQELRILLTVIVLAACALNAYLLRPSQTFPSALRFLERRLGDQHPVHRLLYAPSGYTRPFAWVLPLLIAGIAVIGLWWVFP